jgi:hypothetical protein
VGWLVGSTWGREEHCVFHVYSIFPSFVFLSACFNFSTKETAIFVFVHSHPWISPIFVEQKNVVSNKATNWEKSKRNCLPVLGQTVAPPKW